MVRRRGEPGFNYSGRYTLPLQHHAVVQLVTVWRRATPRRSQLVHYYVHFSHLRSGLRSASTHYGRAPRHARGQYTVQLCI